MSGDLVALVDQGSTSTKGALFSLDGRRVHLESVPVEQRIERDRVVHDPEALAGDVERLARQLVATPGVRALGLACQRSTCLVWDRDGARPLTPALSWQDRSQAARTDAMGEHADLVRRLTGLRLGPHYAAPKLAALLAELPSGEERAAGGELVAGTLDAFLVHRLTGRPATEPGTAGRTLLYSLDGDAWDERLCDLFGVARAALPELRSSVGDWGELAGVPLVAVAGDQQAALVGHGGWRLGVTAAHFGTGAFVLASTGERLVRHDGLLTAVLASTPATRRFQIEGPINSAGSAVDWAREVTGIDLADWTETDLEGRGPWVLPAFAGAAAPWWRERARAVVAGLELSTSRQDLFAAVLGGVAHRVLDCIETLAEADIATDVLRVSGRLTRLGGLVQLLADAGQVAVEIAAEEESGSLGLARLIAARLAQDDAPLLAPPAALRRVEPRWSAAQAGAVREEWRQFARRALEL